jgi:hypothetical protein
MAAVVEFAEERSPADRDAILGGTAALFWELDPARVLSRNGETE